MLAAIMEALKPMSSKQISFSPIVISAFHIFSMVGKLYQRPFMYGRNLAQVILGGFTHAGISRGPGPVIKFDGGLGKDTGVVPGGTALVRMDLREGPGPSPQNHSSEDPNEPDLTISPSGVTHSMARWLRSSPLVL